MNLQRLHTIKSEVSLKGMPLIELSPECAKFTRVGVVTDTMVMVTIGGVILGVPMRTSIYQ